MTRTVHASIYLRRREGMHLGGSTAAHAAVVGVGGVPGLAFGGGKYRCGEAVRFVLLLDAGCFHAC